MGGHHLIKGSEWLTGSATQAVFDAYESAGFRLFAVGGCVRNELLSEPVSDVDMASDAAPLTATAFLKQAGFKVIPTGIDHGTITVLSKGIPHEITTFRKDVETDGRHAVVAFSDRIEDDAQRRDFTINALYANRVGEVFDPVGGLADIRSRIIRFIGNGADRIREDYLRILRFFRFHARYAAVDSGFDPDALAAIAGNLEGLAQLSRERIGAELLKLLGVKDPTPSIMTMAQIGVLPTVLPGCDPKSLGPLVHAETQLDLTPEPIRRLASFVDEIDAKTVRLSKAQLRRLSELRAAAMGTQAPAELGYRLKFEPALSALALRAAYFETPVLASSVNDVSVGCSANFPIKAKDLPPTLAGKEIGVRLRELEEVWIDSGFTLTKSALLG